MDDDTTGDIRQVPTKKLARIRLLDPIDRGLRGDYRDARDDIELDIIHELLHCLPALDIDRMQTARKERRVELTIHPLAVALLEEHRRTMGGDES